jgi:hypothetical protein
MVTFGNKVLTISIYIRAYRGSKVQTLLPDVTLLPLCVFNSEKGVSGNTR